MNLNSDDSQSEFKLVFTKLLEIMLDTDVKLELKVSEGYSKTLYVDVCTEYIDELNRELASVIEYFKKEIS